ncbi:MAG: hypothetical protein SPF57_01135 [Streptococcus orisratti]|uniref:hypothetical protein n=1 Tax=Streptococcus orisratti TaxID=114652 RepID=UPI002A8CEF03|nr:hypothetical protein [Streptococcus orisratti]MDY4001634.1 hypothetical protein [Streptococcus orisratti]MDY5634959.1 hypothetical protein [Streptococcus orisratti]
MKSHLSQYGIKLMFQLRKNMTGYSWFVNYRIILFENQNYPLSTYLDELKFYRRLRFLGYF